MIRYKLLAILLLFILSGCGVKKEESARVKSCKEKVEAIKEVGKYSNKRYIPDYNRIYSSCINKN